MNIAQALAALRPKAEWNLRGAGYEGLEWLDKKQKKPTKKEIDDFIAGNEYSERRRKAYPPLAEQLDALWKGGESTEEMRKRILSVKKKYPKSK